MTLRRLRGYCEEEGEISKGLTDLIEFFKLMSLLREPTGSGEERDLIWGLEEEVTRRQVEEEEKVVRLTEQAEDAEQEAVKLRAEMENIVMYEAANTKIQEVLDNRNAETKRRTNLAVERIKKAEKALKDSQVETERWKEKVEDNKKGEVEDLQVKFAEAVKKVEEKEEENKMAEAEMCALWAELTEVKKKKEVADVEMGGTGSPFHKTIVDTSTNTEKEAKTYVQAAAQTYLEEEKRKEEKRKRGPEPLVIAAVPEIGQGSMSISGGGLRSHEEGGEKAGAMAKAVVVHSIRTNWKVNGFFFFFFDIITHSHLFGMMCLWSEDLKA